MDTNVAGISLSAARTRLKHRCVRQPLRTAEIKQVICSAERYGPVITTSYSKEPAGKAFGGSETDVTEMGAAGKTREK